MNIHFKIVEVNEDTHGIVVRYWSDEVSENDLCTYRDPKGAIVRCATDVGLTLPTSPKLVGAALKEFILRSAPSSYLKTLADVKNPKVDTHLDDMKAQVGVAQTGEPTQSLDELGTPLERAQRAKLREIAAWRFAQEAASITVNGVQVRTDREAQATLAFALLSVREGYIANAMWKAVNGWVRLDAQQLGDIASAVARHVQTCFEKEEAYTRAVDEAKTEEQVLALELPHIL